MLYCLESLESHNEIIIKTNLNIYPGYAVPSWILLGVRELPASCPLNWLVSPCLSPSGRLQPRHAVTNFLPVGQIEQNLFDLDGYQTKSDFSIVC